MPNNSPTAAGHSDPSAQQKKLALIDAINQVFTLFRLNYHNQYLKAFGNSEELNEVKRLWLEMLHKFSAKTILQAAKSVIESSEFLPTIRTMIYHCERASGDQAFPDAHSAYIEACRAPSPKAAYAWSHLAVYYTGRKCDWYFLQSSPESVAFPIFRKAYEELCADVRNGLELQPPSPPALTQQEQPSLDRTSNQQRLSALRKSLNL